MSARLKASKSRKTAPELLLPLSVTLSIVLAGVLSLLGCAQTPLVNPRAEIESGRYVRIDSPYAQPTPIANALVELGIDRANRQVTFKLTDGSQVTAALAATDRPTWGHGCPTNLNVTEMEILRFEPEELVLDSVLWSDPMLVATCPAPGSTIVLREAGGGLSDPLPAVACDWWAGAKCIYFSRLDSVTLPPAPTIGPSPIPSASGQVQGGYYPEGQAFPFGFEILDANNQPFAACLGGFPCSIEATYLHQTPYETSTYQGTAFHFEIAGSGESITFALRSEYADRINLTPDTTYRIIAQKVVAWPDTFGLIIKRGDELVFQGISDWELERTVLIGCLSPIRAEQVGVLAEHYREGGDCFGQFVNTEIMFSQAGGSATLHQGQSVMLGDYEVDLDLARTVAGSYCPDAGAHEISFTISRHDQGEPGSSQATIETSVPISPVAAEAVTFPDPNLERFIRRLINQEAGPILASHLEKLDCFVRLYPVDWSLESDPNQNRLADLRGLEYAGDLKVIYLSGSGLSDLSPLAQLTNLAELHLDHNDLADLAPLQGLLALTQLRIDNNQISDLAPLSPLTNLKDLYARHNQIADVSPLSVLTNLSQLNLDENSITDVSPLSSLVELTQLSLYQNRITDISPLSSLTNLHELSLDYNQITHVSPLSPLVNLTHLSLEGNQITDVSGLSSLVNLTDLSLRGNQITDISPLSSLVNLRHLLLEGNQVTDISALAHLTQLRLVDLRGNRITDISPLVENTGLGEGDMVYLSDNPLSADSINVYLPQLESRAIGVFWQPSNATSTPYPIPTPSPTATAFPTSTQLPTAFPYPTLELTSDGPYAPDEHTLLMLHFDGYYAGTQDEPGTAHGTSFAEGRYGQGVLIDNADTLTYTTAGNLNPEAGTIEFWVRPDWDGDDGQMHIFFETAPADYGIQIGKDGVGNLQFIIWTPTGVQGVGRSLLDWQAGEWHHLAAVWDTSGMAVFIDGQEADSNQAATPPKAIGATLFVGASPDLGWQADAAIDELRISDVTRLGTVDWIELTGPLLVDSQAGRLYASGRVGEVPKTLVMAATDGRLLATYDVTGTLGLDSVHGWLYVDRDDEGLAVLDAQTGALQASIPLPDRGVVDKAYAPPGPAPQADPATGQVLAFRDNVVYVADPEKGLVTRTIPFDFPKAEDCRTLSGPLPIEWATYDSARRFLYLDFETYVCTPWIGHTLVSYDMESGSEIARGGVPPLFSATAFDGSLYGSSWFRMGDGYRWAWRDGRPWFESSGWSSGAGAFVVDPTRQRLYGLSAGGLHVFDAQTMALIMTAPLPVDGQLLGYDPQTDQLYSHMNGELRPWSPSAIQPLTPQPLSASQPPTTSVRSLVVSPNWLQDKTLFGIWNTEDLLGTCWVFGGFGGPLYVSDDGGSTWSRPRGGLLDGCEDFSALAVSPEYARDRTLLAGFIGLGLFRSSDGGQVGEPSSAGLPSMSIEQILLSPGFARDGTAFARVAPAGGRRGVYRSRDGGRSWQTLDMNLDLVAMSPEFDQDQTLMGVAVSYIDYEQHSELLISRDGGDHWEEAGITPAGKGVTSLSLAPLFEKWKVLFAFAHDRTLYRSADGGSSWNAVLSDLPAAPTQLVYAPDIESNRPVFLVAVETLPDQPAIMRGRLYRSGDGGLTWQELELPEDVSPTALAISPNFAQDGLLFVGTADGRVLTFEDWTLMAAGR